MFKPKITTTAEYIAWDLWSCDVEIERKIDMIEQEYFSVFFGCGLSDFLALCLSLEHYLYQKNKPKNYDCSFYIGSKHGRLPVRYESLIKAWVEFIKSELQ